LATQGGSGEQTVNGSYSFGTSLWSALGFPPAKDIKLAKSQKKSNREVRKPKAEKAPKPNASAPSQKIGVVKGLDNIKN
jgi:hypothetical protein